MTKNRSDYSVDELVSVLLAIVLVALLAKPLADVGAIGYWWGFFMICNVVYIIHGMKEGFVKGDPANGLVVVTGPIAFYFWTIIGAWRKYKPTRRSDVQKKTSST